MDINLRSDILQHVQIKEGVHSSDLLDPNLTQEDLILLIAKTVFTITSNGLGFPLLLTSINTDHPNDSALGPHGHSGGTPSIVGHCPMVGETRTLCSGS